jgi:lysophospholipase L1-like esterase
MAKLFFVGDSLTAGAWDERGGWVARIIGKIMQQNLERKNSYCMPYNLGVSGDTFAGVLQRFDDEISRRICMDEDKNKIQIIFSLGTNDSIYFQNRQISLFTENEFKTNVQACVQKAKKYTDNIIMIGNLPVDESLVSPMPWSPEESYQNDRIKLFEDIKKDVSREEVITFLPVFDDWVSKVDYKNLFCDGAHLNTAGHAIFAQKIGKKLLTEAFYKFHGE